MVFSFFLIFYMNLLHFACDCHSYHICDYLLLLNEFDLKAKDNEILFHF